VTAIVWDVLAHRQQTVKNVFSTLASIHMVHVPVTCTGQETAVKSTSVPAINYVTDVMDHQAESVTTVYLTPLVTSTVNATVMNSG
jgi:hypothetical protein